MKKKVLVTALAFISYHSVFAQSGSYNNNKFHQLQEILPTPNEYRTASGAPGHAYWQQKVDYVIKAELNDDNQSLTGSETITYHNNSPDVLTYVWLQLDQNNYAANSDASLTQTNGKVENMSFDALERLTANNKSKLGYTIKSVKDAAGKSLPFTINKTMMRVDLPQPLKPGASFSFSVDWFNYINDSRKTGGRGGMEYFEDGNYIYEMAQWFPRLCVYDDVNGWQNKQFLGTGEFALEFGDYKVSLTVPADHIVMATGILQNQSQVLSKQQIDRLEQAKASVKKPVIIVSQEEATQKEKSHSKDKKTWIFQGDNVRDFAWASSRKFIWDAMGVNVNGKTVMAMSAYPKEGNPLWEKYSTQAAAHTLEVYSRYTFDYPYPVAISVNGPVGGMEYPMICFNGPRPEKDGTYAAETKYGLISVVIHEVGHNFFPMIVNSDERQWSWMDEGLNTFLQYLSEQEWEQNYPSRRGEPKNITSYMASDKSTLEPIMSNSESIIQFGNNAYGKPATALNILRETVMGRELFDYSFKEYAKRWKFKHPEPADFFRTMEDASAVDLDWFWRGWFYGTDAVDIAIKNVSWYKVDSQNPDIEKTAQRQKKDSAPKTVSDQRNQKSIKQYRVDRFPDLQDFYNKYDALEVTESDRKRYQLFTSNLNDNEKQLSTSSTNVYLIDFENVGGLVMPIILQMQYEDGSKEIVRIPAEIWRRNNDKVSKIFVTEKPVKQFTIDPLQETADINQANNSYPEASVASQFQLFKQQQRAKQPNQMQLERSSASGTSNPQNNK
ncbi:M1 family metallopeptidase [Solitalea sp. MAHUQ-68]|uniref:M1 family metallopeptidase n=1 Tax=Solitalea agri TaxID=2953739 RepID=A0A9X2F0P6_9SPHI|nr:M1 family metallopeptidase [Solitalea agri]MCO4291960.1 M1 family metallopeptidase [Solitalea agri]